MPRTPFLRRALCVIAVAMTVACSAMVTAGAAIPRHGRARIVVDHRRVMVDQSFRVRVVDVLPGALVEVRLRLDRGDATTWASNASYVADTRGVVDLASMAPVLGDYTGVDRMGLLWSARLVSSTSPAPALAPWTDEVHLSAFVDGQQVATMLVTRTYVAHGTRVSAVRDRGLVGTIFEPRPRRHRPTLIVVGGSEGGITTAEVEAAVLSSHGYTTLALAYFDPTGALPGLPTKLSLVPLEYFGTAIDWLRAQRSVDADRIGFVGSSKGAELALLVGSRYPQLKTIVAYAPSSVVWAGISSSTTDVAPLLNSSWSDHGQPVPFLEYAFGAPTFFRDYLDAFENKTAAARAAIPVERVNGPVLLIAGVADALWPSSVMANQVMSRLGANGHPYPDRLLLYAGAGHGIFLPYQPTSRVRIGQIRLGGTPTDNARADREHWPILLAFLAHNFCRQAPARR